MPVLTKSRVAIYYQAHKHLPIKSRDFCQLGCISVPWIAQKLSARSTLNRCFAHNNDDGNVPSVHLVQFRYALFLILMKMSPSLHYRV